MITKEELEKAEHRLVALKKQFLRERGWNLTTDNPGKLELWRKIHRDDIYLSNMTMALCIETALAE